MSPIGNLLAAAIALLGWYALGLQGYLSVTMQMAQGKTWIVSVTSFVSFFTVATNTLVAIMLTVPLVHPRSRTGQWLAHAGVRSAAATYMAVVALVYSLALRQVWDPQGPQLLADKLLHDVIPVLYLVFWAVFVEKGHRHWRDIGGWLVYPLLYIGYSFTRGSLIDWYPYYFVDVTQLGYPRALFHAGIIVCAFASIGVLIIAVDRMLANVVRPPSLTAVR